MAALPCLARWANKAVEGSGVRDGNAAEPKTGQPESRTGESAGEPDRASGRESMGKKNRGGAIPTPIQVFRSIHKRSET